MTNDYAEVYQKTADVLVDRILSLIPEHKEILDITDPWDLFKVAGFYCEDLDVTLFMAMWALKKAQATYKGE